MEEIKPKKIDVMYQDFLYPNKDFLLFPIRDCLFKPYKSYDDFEKDGADALDKELLEELKNSGILKRMKKNLIGNYSHGKIRNYKILLDNHEWVKGTVYGKSEE